MMRDSTPKPKLSNPLLTEWTYEPVVGEVRDAQDAWAAGIRLERAIKHVKEIIANEEFAPGDRAARLTKIMEEVTSGQLQDMILQIEREAYDELDVLKPHLDSDPRERLIGAVAMALGELRQAIKSAIREKR